MPVFTVPFPLGAVHPPAPFNQVEDEQDPVHSPMTFVLVAVASAPVVVVLTTIPVPKVAQFWFEVPSVRLAVLATPVPPYAGATSVPCHTPVAIVPTEVSDPVTPSWMFPAEVLVKVYVNPLV